MAEQSSRTRVPPVCGGDCSLAPGASAGVVRWCLPRKDIQLILDKVKYFGYHGDMKPDQTLIDSIRDFNRFYTNVIGLLDRHFLDTPFSLTEGRVLYEIRHTEECTAKTIRSKIDIDEGYLSRIIEKFIHGGLAKKSPAQRDRRLHIIVLTEKGRREFSKLNDNSNKMITHLVEKLSAHDQSEMVESMGRIKALLTRAEQS